MEASGLTAHKAREVSSALGFAHVADIHTLPARPQTEEGFLPLPVSSHLEEVVSTSCRGIALNTPYPKQYFNINTSEPTRTRPLFSLRQRDGGTFRWDAEA